MEAKVAFITGASSGFGMLAALTLAKRGYRVIATMRDPDVRGERLRQLAADEGVETAIERMRLDVTDEAQIGEAVSSVLAAYGKIDVLINNAGYAQGGFTEDVSLQAYKLQFDTNVWGAIAVTKAVIPTMRERRSGTVINVSSISGRVGFPGFGPYAASKFALEGFSESLRLELSPFGVYVVLIEPGSFRTDIWEKGFAQMAGGADSPYMHLLEKVKSYASRAARRGGDPKEVARLIADVAAARRPKLRYAIPRGAAVFTAVKSLIPWRIYEAMALRLFRR